MMAGIDATNMSEYFKRFIVPLAAILICLRILAIIFGRIYPHVYAFFITRFTNKHHKAIKLHKDKLFSDFASIREDSNRRLLALEIGCGPGRNFAMYPPNTSLIIVDPNIAFKKEVAKNAAQHPTLEISKYVAKGAEDLSKDVEDASVDAVISTLTLCSVQDLDAVVSEVHRVLKPGGRFYFIEHTRAHDESSWTLTLQYLIKPLLVTLACCNPMRTPWTVVDQAGFSKVQYTKNDIKSLPLPLRPHVFGYAIK